MLSDIRRRLSRLRQLTCCVPPSQPVKRRIDRSMIGSPIEGTFQHVAHLGSDTVGSELNTCALQMSSKGPTTRTRTHKCAPARKRRVDVRSIGPPRDFRHVLHVGADGHTEINGVPAATISSEGIHHHHSINSILEPLPVHADSVLIPLTTRRIHPSMMSYSNEARHVVRLSIGPER